LFVFQDLSQDLSIDVKGLRRNLRHWVAALGIDGIHRRQAERVLLDSACQAEALRRIEVNEGGKIGKEGGVDRQ
jgi:hypothetical protein